jgi:hypothetical protein
MYIRYRPAQRSPTLLAYSERHCLLIIGHEVSAEDGAHARGGAGALELDHAIDAVGVGAGQRPEAPLRRRLRKRFRTGDTESEGEVGVDVEVSKHLEKREQ